MKADGQHYSLSGRLALAFLGVAAMVFALMGAFLYRRSHQNFSDAMISRLTESSVSSDNSFTTPGQSQASATPAICFTKFCYLIRAYI